MTTMWMPIRNIATTTLLLAGALAAEPARTEPRKIAAAVTTQEFGAIRVGPNVHVSKDRSERVHFEVVLAEDLDRGGDLLAATMYSPKEKVTPHQIAVYASRDRGKTWALVFDKGEGSPGRFSDPAFARGPDGATYFVYLHNETSQSRFIEIIRSGDGGRIWEPAAKIAGRWDRPFLAVDRTSGKYRDRLYCQAAEGLFASSDGGRSFGKVRSWERRYAPFSSGNPVVLADGTLAVLYSDLNGPANQGCLGVRTSTDGGDSFSKERVVAEYRMADTRFGTPGMAADSARPGRLYVVWQDKLPSGRAAILFAASADKGATFSEPVLLSEQPEIGGHHAFVPSLAVNAAGTVAVMWYDTRSSAKGQSGWDVRLRASGDGGKTWGPSARLTEETTSVKKTRTYQDHVGHTAGLAAEADGAFRCLWVDGRTGVAQVWTATVQIDAARESRR
jgi:hypothetical protein